MKPERCPFGATSGAECGFTRRKATPPNKPVPSCPVHAQPVHPVGRGAILLRSAK